MFSRFENLLFWRRRYAAQRSDVLCYDDFIQGIEWDETRETPNLTECFFPRVNPVDATKYATHALTLWFKVL